MGFLRVGCRVGCRVGYTVCRVGLSSFVFFCVVAALAAPVPFAAAVVRPVTTAAELQAALDVVDPGDFVELRASFLVGTKIVAPRPGTPAAPITIRSDPSGPRRILTGSGLPSTNAGHILELAGVCCTPPATPFHYVVEGVGFTNAGAGGMRLSFVGDVELRDVWAYDNEKWGIFTDFAERLWVHNCTLSGSAVEHGSYFSNSGGDHVFEDNIVHENAGNGLHMNGDSSMGGPGVVTGVVVRRNVFWGNGGSGGSAINMDGTRFTQVYDNVIFDNLATGISTYAIDGAAAGDNWIAFNTIFHANGQGRAAILVSGTIASTNNTIVNNVLRSQASKAVIAFESAADPAAQHALDFNVVSVEGDAAPYLFEGASGAKLTLLEWRARGFGTNDVPIPDASFAALFESLAARNFRPVGLSSAVVDAGTASFLLPPALTGLPADFDGVARPQGPGPDVGAFELPQGGGGTAPASTTTSCWGWEGCPCIAGSICRSPLYCNLSGVCVMGATATPSSTPIVTTPAVDHSTSAVVDRSTSAVVDRSTSPLISRAPRPLAVLLLC